MEDRICKVFATTEGGYEAIGGEIFIFLLPFLWWVMPSLKEKKE